MSDTIKVISITELEAIEKLREEFRSNAADVLSDSDLMLLDDVIEKANAFDLMGIDPDSRTMDHLVYMTYDQPRDCAASDAWPGDQLLAKAKEHREGLKHRGEMMQEPVNVTRARSEPSFSFIDVYGRSIQKMHDTWIRYAVMDPDAKTVKEALEQILSK